MGKPELHILRDSHATEPASSEPTVRLRLHEVFPLLMHAHRHDYGWLKDLSDDAIMVTPDLADVLRTFAEIHRSKKRA